MKIPHASFPQECLERKKLGAPPRGQSVWLTLLWEFLPAPSIG